MPILLSMKLNLGCGSNKIDGYINIDVEESCKPDVKCDFRREHLPFDLESIEEVVFFHTLEHIEKRYHQFIFAEIWRVLKPGMPLYISYPDFQMCVKNWEKTKHDPRNHAFAEATIFGRQLYPSDYHVCIVDSEELRWFLMDNGFTDVVQYQEPSPNHFNTVTTCVKGKKMLTYEEVVEEEIERMILV